MELTVNEAYENYAERFGLRLLAGQSGLNRALKWVYVAEDYTTSDFLRGGELIITTGVISGGSPDWLMRFLRHMTYQKTCGLILNLGPYLRADIVTREVAEYCDSHAYPLFSMPWQTHIYDVTRVLYEQIYRRTRRDEQLAEAFRALLTEPQADSRFLSRLTDAGYPEDGRYTVIALQCGDMPALRGRIESALPRRFFPVFREQDCLLVCTDEAEAETVFAGLPDTYAGIGSRAEGLRGLYDSARRARDMLRLGQEKAQPLTRWDDSGLFRLLTELPDRRLLRQYADSYLAPVHEYDRQHHSRLADTMALYLRFDGSVQAVAAEAFCHRNTVNHRLQILKDTLGYRLDDPAVRFALQTAFLTEEYLKTGNSFV